MNESFGNQQLPQSLYKEYPLMSELLNCFQKALFFVLSFSIPLSRGQKFNFFILLKAFQQLCWTFSYQNNKNCILLGSIALETKASQLKWTLQCHFIIKQSTRWTACYNRCFLAPGTKPARSKTAQSLCLSQDGSVSGTTLVQCLLL